MQPASFPNVSCAIDFSTGFDIMAGDSVALVFPDQNSREALRLSSDGTLIIRTGVEITLGSFKTQIKKIVINPE